MAKTVKTPLERKVRLIERGVTLQDIQTAIIEGGGLKVSIGHISQVIRNGRPSASVRKAAARLAGWSVRDMFGSGTDAGGDGGGNDTARRAAIGGRVPSATPPRSSRRPSPDARAGTRKPPR